MKTLYKNFFRKAENDNPVITVIKTIPIFENLSKKDLDEVARLTHERTYKLMNTSLRNMHLQRECML